jgi:nucleotide-binding universal stress UspA family protein
MTIVCGTDFSAASSGAVRAAAALARRFDVPLVIAHAREEAVPDARARLAEQERALRSAGIDARAELVEGPADETLAREAQRLASSILVVAGTGRDGADESSLGHVADRTAQLSPVPLLLVRDARPFEAWGDAPLGRALEVLVGYEPSETADAALRWAHEQLPRAGPCNTRAAHVYWPPEQHGRLKLAGPLHGAPVPPEIEGALGGELRARMRRTVGREVPLLLEGSLGRTADHLAAMAQAASCDLLVVGTHQRSGLRLLWHGSVSYHVLRLAPMNVACVPAPAEAGETR